ALQLYHRTIIFISHYVHFIRAIATSVLYITACPAGTRGRLTFYPCDYDYYLYKSKATSARIALTAGRDAPEVNGQKPEVGKQTGSGSRKQKAQKRLEADSRNAVAKA